MNKSDDKIFAFNRLNVDRLNIEDESVREYIAEFSPDALFAEGLDSAILGIVERFAMTPVVLYDEDKCIEIFMEQDMTLEEAREFFEYNVLGAWLGDGTPCFAILIKNNFSNSSS